jgi:hypothetical protein
MASKDIHNAMKFVGALEPIVVNNTSEGTGDVVDTAGYESVELVVYVGESGDTLSGSLKHELAIQEGALANGSDMADVASPTTDLIGSTTALFATIDADGEDGQVYKVGYKGSARYIRLKDTVTGTHTNGTPMAAVAILGHPRSAPPA